LCHVIVPVHVLLRRWAISGGRVTVAREIIGKVFRGGLRNILSSGRDWPVLAIVVVVVVVIIITVVVGSGRGCGGLIRNIIGCSLNIVVIPLLIVGVIVGLIDGARLGGGGRELTLIILITGLRIIAARSQCCRLNGAAGAVLVVRVEDVVDVVRSCLGSCTGRLIVAVRVWIRRAGSIRGRWCVVPLRVLVILLRPAGRRRNVRCGSLIVRVRVVIITVVVPLAGRCRRGSRRRVVEGLFPAGLANATLLRRPGVLARVLFVRFVRFVVVFLIISIVQIAAAAATQQVTVVVAGRGHSVHRVRGRTDRVAGFATLKMILRLGVATEVVVMYGLQTGTDPVQIEVVAGVVERRSLAVHVVPVRAGLALLIEGGIVRTQEPRKRFLKQSIRELGG